jgi:hypothetical protein
MTTATLRGLWRVVRPRRAAHASTAAGSTHEALEPGGLWSRRLRGEGLRLTCCEGQLWLTREGDVTDTVVSAGESVRVEGPGLMVVQALRPARFSTRGEACPP